MLNWIYSVDNLYKQEKLNRINKNNFCIRIKIQKFLHGIRAIADLGGSPAGESKGSSCRKQLEKQQKRRSEGATQFSGADSHIGKGDVIQRCVLASPHNSCAKVAQKQCSFGLKLASVIQIWICQIQKSYKNSEELVGLNFWNFQIFSLSTSDKEQEEISFSESF